VLDRVVSSLTIVAVVVSTIGVKVEDLNEIEMVPALQPLKGYGPKDNAVTVPTLFFCAGDA